MLTTASLDFYLHHQNKFREILKDHLESLAGLRQRHLERLCNHLDKYDSGIISDLRRRKTLSIILECMIPSVDLISTGSKLIESLYPPTLQDLDLTDL